MIVFTASQREIVVLNKVFDIEPASADRVCATLWRAFPQVHRIRLEVMFEPGVPQYPSRIVLEDEDTSSGCPPLSKSIGPLSAPAPARNSASTGEGLSRPIRTPVSGCSTEVRSPRTSCAVRSS